MFRAALPALVPRAIQSRLDTILEWFAAPPTSIEIIVHTSAPLSPPHVTIAVNLFSQQQPVPNQNHPAILVHSPTMPTEYIAIHLATQ